MNRSTLKSEISTAVKTIAEKHGLTVKVNPIEKAQDHLETTLTITEAPKVNVTVTKSLKSKSRKEQVKRLYSKGITSVKDIVAKIGSHPSYISRLLSEVKHEEVAA